MAGVAPPCESGRERFGFVKAELQTWPTRGNLHPRLSHPVPIAESLERQGDFLGPGRARPPGDLPGDPDTPPLIPFLVPYGYCGSPVDRETESCDQGRAGQRKRRTSRSWSMLSTGYACWIVPRRTGLGGYDMRRARLDRARSMADYSRACGLGFDPALRAGAHL